MFRIPWVAAWRPYWIEVGWPFIYYLAGFTQGLTVKTTQEVKRPHWLQEYLTLSWTDLIWLFRLSFAVNRLPHLLQRNFTFSWTDFIWLFRLSFAVNWLLHWSQEYLTFSCIDWLCLFRFPWCLHWKHGYLILSWSDSICLFRLPFVEALYSH